MWLSKRRQGLVSGQPVIGIARKLGAVVLISVSALSASTVASASNPLAAAIESDHRIEAAKRDVYRNPEATLSFFKVEPHHTVVEVWPGGGWYTDILAPYLKDKGTFYAAHFAKDSPVEYFAKSRAKFDKKLASSPIYSKVNASALEAGHRIAPAPKGSADRVLTFRNVHNWMSKDAEDTMFKAFYDALKPGGLLGVVEHRAKPGTSLQDMIKSGYVTEAAVKDMAKAAGFEFVASSSVNRNVKDTAKHPKGVWTLPPRLRLGDEDKAKYLDIGESDRMTLLFKKP